MISYIVYSEYDYVLQTTIKLSNDTKQKLSEIGKKGMTYDEIVNQLMSKRSV